jgi:hypothetical protein
MFGRGLAGISVIKNVHAQVGKSTLARQVAATYPNSLYLDLESERDRARLGEPELNLPQWQAPCWTRYGCVAGSPIATPPIMMNVVCAGWSILGKRSFQCVKVFKPCRWCICAKFLGEWVRTPLSRPFSLLARRVCWQRCKRCRFCCCRFR